MKFFGPISLRDLRRPSVIALIIANLVPVFGVLFLHWEVFPLMFLFWSENVIIGVFNVLKMLLAAPANPLANAGKFFIVPFFCVHYGMFTFVHGIFVIVLFGGGLRTGMGFPNLETFTAVMHEFHLGWAVLGLAISRGISFVSNYLLNGEYKRASLPLLMFQPYGRIIVLHLAIIGGGFLMLALHSPVTGLLLLIVLKTFLDLSGHLREREKFAAPPTTV